MSRVATPSARVAGGGGPEAPDRSRRTALVVLVAAVVVLAGSVVAAPWIVQRVSGAPASVAGTGTGWTGGGMMGAGGNSGGMMGGGSAGMMSGRVWLAGDGQAVTSISTARARAALAASSGGLHPGEIIRFRDNFYVELKDASGAAVTEVLVNPATGAVGTEPGPAMMWNTGSRVASVSSDQAKIIASQWLQANRAGERVASVDAYPGYYTADTADAASGTMVGMLSVNATTGAVWYHTWHGAFVAKEDV
jgi:hypothetical protein